MAPRHSHLLGSSGYISTGFDDPLAAVMVFIQLCSELLKQWQVLRCGGAIAPDLVHGCEGAFGAHPMLKALIDTAEWRSCLLHSVRVFGLMRANSGLGVFVSTSREHFALPSLLFSLGTAWHT